MIPALYYLDPREIEIPEDWMKREPSPALIESMQAVGFFSLLPVLKVAEGRWLLVAGAERLLAACRLHLERVPVLEVSPDHAELIAIYENMARRVPSAHRGLELIEQLAKIRNSKTAVRLEARDVPQEERDGAPAAKEASPEQAASSGTAGATARADRARRPAARARPAGGRSA